MTNEQIVEMLNDFLPDQSAVIEQMAEVREISEMTPEIYRAMMLEEAELSFDEDEEYASGLRKLAAKILD